MKNELVIEEVEPEPGKPIKAIISLSLLIFGTILTSVGAGLVFGYGVGIMVFGALLMVEAVMFGLERDK